MVKKNINEEGKKKSGSTVGGYQNLLLICYLGATGTFRHDCPVLQPLSK